MRDDLGIDEDQVRISGVDPILQKRAIVGVEDRKSAAWSVARSDPWGS